MSVSQIAVLAFAAILVNQLKRGRSLALLGISALVIYWLQPHQESVNLTFWFPTMTLALTVIFWLVTSTPGVRGWKQNGSAVAIIVAVVILVDLNRYFKVEYFFITSTPRFQWVAAALLGIVFIGFILARAREYFPIVSILLISGLIVALVLMKTPSLMTMLYEIVANLRGKGTRSISGFSWLGFSYVAFRLLHTLIDRRTGRLQPVPLAEYVSYVIFFPAFVAGPIDRIERFVKDLEQPLPLDRNGWMEAGARLFQGLFKKFVIADALAWIALNEIFALEVKSTGWMWFVLYAYSLQIYFDFSGYTDIAIGLGRLLGVRLPENFDSPYLKPNLTQFWNSWHMTLTQWFRSYFFNPLARALRSARAPLPLPFTILVTQVATMILIGLWHGVTLNFFLWGLWHGMGLFIQNRWSEWMRTRPLAWGTTSAGEVVMKYSNIFLTFQFVSLGWLFFALPDPGMSLQVFLKLFGIR